jgi:hypothetical protein
MTREFSMPEAAPPAPAPDRPEDTGPHAGRVAAVASGAVALLAIVLIALVVIRAGPSARTASADAGPGSRPPVEPPRSPCPGPTVDVPPGAVAVVGDPDGAGCTIAVLWWPDRAEVDLPDGTGARHRFALGRPGDQLVLGDWDGDGRDTPALYDPFDGTVVRFDGWARADESLPGTLVTTDAPPDGIARLVRVANGPDQLDVDPAPP